MYHNNYNIIHGANCNSIEDNTKYFHNLLLGQWSSNIYIFLLRSHKNRPPKIKNKICFM